MRSSAMSLRKEERPAIRLERATARASERELRAFCKKGRRMKRATCVPPVQFLHGPSPWVPGGGYKKPFLKKTKTKYMYHLLLWGWLWGSGSAADMLKVESP